MGEIIEPRTEVLALLVKTSTVGAAQISLCALRFAARGPAAQGFISLSALRHDSADLARYSSRWAKRSSLALTLVSAWMRSGKIFQGQLCRPAGAQFLFSHTPGFRPGLPLFRALRRSGVARPILGESPLELWNHPLKYAGQKHVRQRVAGSCFAEEK